jgi:Flp pilus assembly protein TadG
MDDSMIRNQDGQGLVEFALVLPIILLLAVGIFDFGRILYAHSQLELIAQESVRIAGLGQKDAAIISFAQSNFNGNPEDLTITILPTEAARKPGSYVMVTVSHPESFFDVLGGLSIPYTVESSSTIRIE